MDIDAYSEWFPGKSNITNKELIEDSNSNFYDDIETWNYNINYYTKTADSWDWHFKTLKDDLDCIDSCLNEEKNDR